jgi:hypothetical protein
MMVDGQEWCKVEDELLKSELLWMDGLDNEESEEKLNIKGGERPILYW